MLNGDVVVRVGSTASWTRFYSAIKCASDSHSRPRDKRHWLAARW